MAQHGCPRARLPASRSSSVATREMARTKDSETTTKSQCGTEKGIVPGRAGWLRDGLGCARLARARDAIGRGRGVTGAWPHIITSTSPSDSLCQSYRAGNVYPYFYFSHFTFWNFTFYFLRMEKLKTQNGDHANVELETIFGYD